jgi:hypothetical protein
MAYFSIHDMAMPEDQKAVFEIFLQSSLNTCLGRYNPIIKSNILLIWARAK